MERFQERSLDYDLPANLNIHANKSAAALRNPHKAPVPPLAEGPYDAEYAAHIHGHGAELDSLYAPSYHFAPHHIAHKPLHPDAVPQATEAAPTPEAEMPSQAQEVPMAVKRPLDAVALARKQRAELAAATRRAVRVAAGPKAVSKAVIRFTPVEKRIFAQPVSLSAIRPNNESAPVQAGFEHSIRRTLAQYADNPVMMQRFFTNGAVQYAQERGLLRGRWEDNERGRGLVPRQKRLWWGRTAKAGRGGQYVWGNERGTTQWISDAQQRAHHLERVAEEQRYLRVNNRLPPLAGGAKGGVPDWTQRVATNLIEDLYESHGGDLKPRVKAEREESQMEEYEAPLDIPMPPLGGEQPMPQMPQKKAVQRAPPRISARNIF